MIENSDNSAICAKNPRISNMCVPNWMPRSGGTKRTNNIPRAVRRESKLKMRTDAWKLELSVAELCMACDVAEQVFSPQKKG